MTTYSGQIERLMLDNAYQATSPPVQRCKAQAHKVLFLQRHSHNRCSTAVAPPTSGLPTARLPRS
ncbi:hypothetical protein RSK60_480005 [Ralstonia solanacearum K60]|nr:hypothetical protein RSK60_480005 [Ralstonia solanacearum K60]